MYPKQNFRNQQKNRKYVIYSYKTQVFEIFRFTVVCISNCITLSLLTELKSTVLRFLNFHSEGKGCPDTYGRRDYEALAR